MLRIVALLTTLIAFAMPASAFAEPPQVGTRNAVFSDQMGGPVMCDTLEELQAIAAADDPLAKFAAFKAKRNERGYPTCVAVPVVVSLILDVKPIGSMTIGNVPCTAWGVQAGLHLWLLYWEVRPSTAPPSPAPSAEPVEAPVVHQGLQT